MDRHQHTGRSSTLVCRRCNQKREDVYIPMGKTETRNAEMINSRSESFIRFRWLDEESPKAYFELKIQYNELTTDHLLEITDFAEPGEENDMRNLWDSQIEMMRRAFGI